MIRNLAFTALVTLALAACSGLSHDGGGVGGQSPANFTARADEQHALATIRAAEQGKPVTWRVSASSHGSVTPAVMQFADRAGRLCRTLSQARSQDGALRSRDVTACNNGDGLWVVTEQVVDKAD